MHYFLLDKTKYTKNSDKTSICKLKARTHTKRKKKNKMDPVVKFRVFRQNRRTSFKKMFKKVLKWVLGNHLYLPFTKNNKKINYLVSSVK